MRSRGGNGHPLWPQLARSGGPFLPAAPWDRGIHGLAEPGWGWGTSGGGGGWQRKPLPWGLSPPPTLHTPVQEEPGIVRGTPFPCPDFARLTGESRTQAREERLCCLSSVTSTLDQGEAIVRIVLVPWVLQLPPGI